MSPQKIDVSIIIPARNEENNIGQCLAAVLSQECPLAFEVIVIDSGSADNTAGIVRQFQGIKLVQIAAAEFGHGKTRNLGAQSAAGDFLVFLNADAVPCDRHWLSSLLEEFKGDPSVAGVFSRQVPKSGCHLYMARDLQRAMPPARIEKRHAAHLDYFLFSTVSAAIRRDAWSRQRFDDEIAIAEDQRWAERILESGRTLVYTPASAVFHSHNYTFSELYRVKRQVSRSTSRFANRASALFLGFFLAVGGAIGKFSGDCFFIMKQRLPVKSKAREMLLSLGARLASFSGRYAGWLAKRK